MISSQGRKSYDWSVGGPFVVFHGSRYHSTLEEMIEFLKSDQSKQMDTTDKLSNFDAFVSVLVNTISEKDATIAKLIKRIMALEKWE